MTTVDPNFTETADREARRARLFTRINAADKWFQVLGLSWATPLLRAAAGDKQAMKQSDLINLNMVSSLNGISILVTDNAQHPNRMSNFCSYFAKLAATVERRNVSTGQRAVATVSQAGLTRSLSKRQCSPRGRTRL